MFEIIALALNFLLLSKTKLVGFKGTQNYLFLCCISNIQITSYGNQTVQQFVADNEIDMAQWITCIQTTIKHLVNNNLSIVFNLL